jgi:hypothetical protein
LFFVFFCFAIVVGVVVVFPKTFCLKGVIIDPNDVTQKGSIQYDDNNLGVPDTNQYLFSNNPAHAQTEADGTLWSTVSVVKFETQSHLKIK